MHLNIIRHVYKSQQLTSHLTRLYISDEETVCLIVILFFLDRETLEDGSEVMFDHGAQYFTIKSLEVQRLVDQWEASGLVSEWKGVFGTVNVATGTLVEDKVSFVSALLASTLICKVGVCYLWLPASQESS